MLKFWKTSTSAIIKLMRIYFLRELFSPDNNSKRCDECQIQFKNCRLKKTTQFSISWKSTDRRLHEPARGGFKEGPIIYGSLNYDPKKDFYDFYDEEKIVDTFFNSVNDLLVSGKDFKIQGYFELKN